jgi:hypothetical protein
MAFIAANSEHTVSKVTIYTTANILNYNTTPITTGAEFGRKNITSTFTPGAMG